MEQIKDGWDLFLLPKTWHKRLNTSVVSLVFGLLVVGFYNVFSYSKSILNDFIIGTDTGVVKKTLLLILVVAVNGFLDVFCFAWPIADFCRYIARKSNKFIAQGFNVIFMKSYAYSHLVFYPVLLILNPTGLYLQKLVQDTDLLTKIIITIIYVWGLLQIVIQPGILLRTISIKSKLDFSAKILAALAIFVWMDIEGEAIRFTLELAYRLFDLLY